MAGSGIRFKNAGYTFPKPLIPISNMDGTSMIGIVVKNLNLKGNYIYIYRTEYEEKYNIKIMLEQFTPTCKCITIDYLTEGSACTCLLSKSSINNNTPLIIADCDHFPVWDSQKFIDILENEYVDGVTLTFPNTHPKFSYIKTDNNNFVTEIKEKVVISNKANVGVYAWKRGSDFVKYAERMISKNIRVQNEFYVSPVFNEAIQDGKQIKEYHISKQWELGTPEDLDYFIKNYGPI
jgi:NDP-sugar pyrophosphorylase family protein